MEKNKDTVLDRDLNEFIERTAREAWEQNRVFRESDAAKSAKEE